MFAEIQIKYVNTIHKNHNRRYQQFKIFRRHGHHDTFFLPRPTGVEPASAPELATESRLLPWPGGR